jgi:hypothetical protein
MNTDKHRYCARRHLCLSVFMCGSISFDLRRKRREINPKKLKLNSDGSTYNVNAEPPFPSPAYVPEQGKRQIAGW